MYIRQLSCGRFFRLPQSPSLLFPLYHLPPHLYLLPPPSTFLYRPNWIQLYGEAYHKSDFVHIGWQSDDLPQFGKILDIVNFGSFPLLLVEESHSKGINNHLIAYLICCTHSTVMIYLPKLATKTVFSAHSYDGDNGLYISLKSDILRV